MTAYSLSTAVEKEIVNGAITAFVDRGHASLEAFRPQFVSNNYRLGRKVLSTLEVELSKCSSFAFSVAFVTQSGLAPLLQVLRELEERGVSGRVLTTDYLAFSEPRALEKLAAYSNIEVRMYQSGGLSGNAGFHTKGYLFSYDDGTRKALVGSSNLTNSALTVNKEWNTQISSTMQGEMLCELMAEFEVLWGDACPLVDVLNTYRQIYLEKKQIIRAEVVSEIELVRLEPNTMQASFVKSLDEIIELGEKRALLISATGTGKTYASAFAMRHVNPIRVLFLAHREQVLKQSIRSYKRVFGSTKTFGLLSGNAREMDADYLFATMQTISKDQILGSFARDEFAMIVIDEVHRAGSSSYQKILDYFQPDFCLGMTASPDRPDGFDIYGLFDNNIAYEIRLQKALEEGLLCPFHYFGITDLSIDGRVIDDKTEFNHLVSDDRVSYIINQAEYYGYSGDRVKGLVFCRTKLEARDLSDKFNEKGYKTVSLSGDDSQAAREDAILRLAANVGSPYYEDRIDYIFSVDIFNEGIDVPEVNQVIMLRPTESPIVFVQQLGRGLRKAEGKEYVVVLDFIGNYSNNFLIPIALSGDRSYNKDTIRKYVMEGSRVIPGCSSIHFDEISKARIFESINNSTTSLKLLKDKYLVLKHKLGRVPTMVDFQKYGEIDPLLFIEKKRSYYRFLVDCDHDYRVRLSCDEELVLEFVSSYFANGKRPHELVALKELLLEGIVSKEELASELSEYYFVEMKDKEYDSALRVLDKSFVNSPSDKQKYSDLELIDYGSDGLVLKSQDFGKMLENEDFVQALLDVIDFGLLRSAERYVPNDDGFALYEKYTRKDACRLLNWDRDDSATMYGYRIKYGTCPIFVTYHKEDDIASSTQYEDTFESQRLFSWMTRSRVTLRSSEAQKIMNAETNGMDMRLFVKKSDGEGCDFYYLGKVKPVSWQEKTICDDDGKELPIVNFKLELEHAVRDDIYEYFAGVQN